MLGQRILLTFTALLLPWLVAVPAQSQVLDHPIEVEGTVIYQLKKGVRNTFKGVIQSINVRLNTAVRKGQILGTYKLDAFERNRLRQDISTSKIDRTALDLEEITAEIHAKQRDLDADLVLVKEGMISPLSVDEKRNALALLKDKLAYTQEVLRIEKRNLVRTKDLISKDMGGIPIGKDIPATARLISPIAGQVISIIEEPNWDMEKKTTCFTVADTANVLVQAKIYLEDYPKIVEGMKAVITSKSQPGKKFHATISRIPLTPISKAYANLSYYSVELEIHNADDLLREGNSVMVTIPPQAVETAEKP